MPWYVLYTNPKAEKKVAEQLTKVGIANYCPLITKVQQWSDRKKKIVTPLFSSYVFVHVDDNQRNSVFAIKGVVRYLFWLGKPAVVREDEILTIKNWLDNSNCTIEIEAIRIGDKVTISEGPFKSQAGIVQEVNKHSVRLILESIGMILTMKLSD